MVPVSMSVAPSVPTVVLFGASTGKLTGDVCVWVKTGGSLIAAAVTETALFETGGVVMPSSTVIVNPVKTEPPGAV